MTHTWVRSADIYGIPIGIDEVASNENTYLLHSKNHPDELGCFNTNIIGDIKHWMNVPSHRVTDNLKNVKLMTIQGKLTCVATSLTDNGKQLVVLQSINGIDWHEVFRTEDYSESYEPIYNTEIQARTIVCCVGCMFMSNDGVQWNKVVFPKDDVRVIGIAAANGKFYFLANTSKKPVILVTTDGNTFTMSEVPWTMESITMSGNGEQVVVSCRLHGVSCLLYFNDDINEYKTHLLPINRVDAKKDFVTVYDMVYHNNQWVFVGSSEYDNGTGSIISLGSFVFRVDGNVTSLSKFNRDNIEARQLEKIRILNGNLVAFGNSFPNLDNCIFTIEELKDE